MVRFETIDGGRVLRATLARPEKRNALTPEMLGAILERCEALEADPGDLRAVVVDGEGGSFCAGFDLALCRDDPDAMATLLESLSRAIRALRRQPLPVALAAHGAAVAGGCALLGGADYVVVDDGARLGYPVVKLGVSPAVTSPAVARAIGMGAARERLLDPELIDGAEAARIGLAHERVADADAARSRAAEVASAWARKGPRALRRTRAWLNTVDGSDDEAMMEGALRVSLTLAGGEEERSRLAALWKKG